MKHALNRQPRLARPQSVVPCGHGHGLTRARAPATVNSLPPVDSVAPPVPVPPEQAAGQVRDLQQVLKAASAPQLVQAQDSGMQTMEYEVDSRGIRRVKYEPKGWQYWDWQGKRVHYVRAGPEDGRKVVLVHGYGASAYHWRYNIPALVDAGYQVYALDLLGFGFSEKAIVDYSNGKQWIAEVHDFIDEIVGGGPVVLAGNSLGGYVSLATASNFPEKVRAVALLNGAGPFDDPSRKIPDPDNWRDQLELKVKTAFKRGALWFGFIQAKQPGRIKDVLELVYFNKDVIDEDLVSSIVNPTNDPQASEVFFLINNFKGPPITVNSLLSNLKVPLLLLWGDKDPWIVPATGVKIKGLYPSADLRFVSAGHCPHDDNSEDSNRELIDWMQTVQAQSVPAVQAVEA